MATDPATLLSQANCYACYGIGGTFSLLELLLVTQWANESANIIPAGTVYTGSLYVLPANLTVGLGFYVITLGPNEASADVGAVGGSIHVTGTTPTPFQLASNGLIFINAVTPNTLVTAKLVRTG